MTKEEMAARLNGREYGNEMTPEEEEQARVAGLVVVFGASDDLIEFRGALNDEGSVYDGGTVYILDGALYEMGKCDCDDAQAADKRAKKHGASIKAVWSSEDEPDWTYETKIPHATFDVMEEGEAYCRGIVFELPKAAA